MSCLHGCRQYLHEMSRLILRSNGVVDKYIGDAIVAFWNAPIEVPDHPQVACHIALMSLQRLRLLQNSNGAHEHMGRGREGRTQGERAGGVDTRGEGGRDGRTESGREEQTHGERAGGADKTESGREGSRT